MGNTPSLMPLLWFAAVVALIPVVLWLLKRTPMGGGGSAGLMRSIAVLPVSGTQRIVTIEVGHGDDRQWLVLGVTPGNITTLHTMAPQAAPPAVAAAVQPVFADLLARLRTGGARHG